MTKMYRIQKTIVSNLHLIPFTTIERKDNGAVDVFEGVSVFSVKGALVVEVNVGRGIKYFLCLRYDLFFSYFYTKIKTVLNKTKALGHYIFVVCKKGQRNYMQYTLRPFGAT